MEPARAWEWFEAAGCPWGALFVALPGLCRLRVPMLPGSASDGREPLATACKWPYRRSSAATVRAEAFAANPTFEAARSKLAPAEALPKCAALCVALHGSAAQRMVQRPNQGVPNALFPAREAPKRTHPGPPAASARYQTCNPSDRRERAWRRSGGQPRPPIAAAAAAAAACCRLLLLLLPRLMERPLLLPPLIRTTSSGAPISTHALPAAASDSGLALSAPCSSDPVWPSCRTRLRAPPDVSPVTPFFSTTIFPSISTISTVRQTIRRQLGWRRSAGQQSCRHSAAATPPPLHRHSTW